jgi:hypothetical protein
LLEVLSRELSQRRNEYLTRATGLNTRATILMSAATLVVAVQASTGRSIFAFAGITLALAASIIGLSVLFPRTRPSNSVGQWEESLWDVGQLQAARSLLAWESEDLSLKEHALVRRGRLLKWGFILFIGTILCTLLAVANRIWMG